MYQVLVNGFNAKLGIFPPRIDCPLDLHKDRLDMRSIPREELVIQILQSEALELLEMSLNPVPVLRIAVIGSIILCKAVPKTSNMRKANKESTPKFGDITEERAPELMLQLGMG